MANIQALPNELIFRILRYQLPTDLLNLSLTCRHIHNLATPLLDEGQEIVSYLSSSSSGHYIDLLRRVLINPRFALYVTRLRIMKRCPSWKRFFSNGKPFMPTFVPLSDRDLRLFRAACVEFEDVFQNVRWEVEDRMRSLECGDQAVALTLLFCFLPHLTSIDVVENALHEDQFPFINYGLAYIKDMKCPVALANLSSAFFRHRDTEGGIRLDFVIPFAALPAMRTIACRALSQESAPSRFRYPSEVSPCFGLTDLRLEYSCIGSSALAYILERSIGLRRFYYEYGGATVGLAEFMPSEFRDALLRYCKDTLEHLTLATAYDDGYGYGEQKRFAGSLRDFGVLKMVDMRFEMLVDCDENELDSDCNSVVSDAAKVENLADTLPASLETLRIPGPVQHTEELLDQLMDLLERKGESQTQLTKIAIESVDDIEAFMRGALDGACKAVGVSLKEW